MKRSIDIVVSGVALIALTPLLLLLCLLVRLTSEGPAMFWSERTGYLGRPFMMPKLRTMTQCSKVMSRESADASDISVTRLGNLLRKSSFYAQRACLFLDAKILYRTVGTVFNVKLVQ